jgi:hypothetical protein
VLRSGRILTGAEIEYTFTTNNDGTYNLNYRGLLAASIEVSIKFDGATIAGQPMQFAVRPGDTVAARSTLVIGSVYPVDANNAPVGSTNATTGLYLVAAESNGKIVSRDIFSRASEALSWLDKYGTNDIAAAVIGEFTPTVALITAFESKGAAEFSKLMGLTCNFASCKGASWAFLRTAVGAKKEHYVWAEPTRQLELASTECTLYAHSFGQDTQSPQAYINIVPDAKSFPAGGVFSDGSNQISVIARDAYDNIQTGGIDVFELLLTPDATLKNQSAVNVRAAGYYYKSFVSQQATVYNVFAKLSGANIRFSPSDLSVIADLAVASQSNAVGTNLFSAMAGEASTFRIALKDRFGNQIDTTDNYLSNDITVSMQHQASATKIAFVLRFSDVRRVLEVEYMPIVLGEYLITIMVNDLAMILSSNIMAVSAGPMSPPNCLYYLPVISGTPTYGAYGTALAGKTKVLMVKARDQFDNDINIPNQYPFEFKFTAASMAFVSDVKSVYDGDGVYAISFMPEKAPQMVAFDIVSNGVVVALVATMTMSIDFGEPSIKSTFTTAATVKAGDAFGVAVACRDTKSNVIATCNASKFFIKATFGVQQVTLVTRLTLVTLLNPTDSYLSRLNPTDSY